jgi:uncharacterized protein YunC (DUF1805 family)
MVHIAPVQLDDLTCIAIEIDLPKTHLVAIQVPGGYIMCGALDVELLSTRLADRRIVAARAVGVKTVAELLSAPLEAVTPAASACGVHPGMSGREALKRMAEAT